MQHPIQTYADAFAMLTPASLESLLALMSANVRFSDPFHTVTGKEAVAGIFQRMFTTVQEPRFAILSVTPHDAHMAYVHWHFTGESQRACVSFAINGLSQIHFNHEGLVTIHDDYWDASQQFYAKIPLLGAVIRWIAARA